MLWRPCRGHGWITKVGLRWLRSGTTKDSNESTANSPLSQAIVLRRAMVCNSISSERERHSIFMSLRPRYEQFTNLLRVHTLISAFSLMVVVIMHSCFSTSQENMKK